MLKVQSSFVKKHLSFKEKGIFLLLSIDQSLIWAKLKGRKPSLVDKWPFLNSKGTPIGHDISILESFRYKFHYQHMARASLVLTSNSYSNDIHKSK